MTVENPSPWLRSKETATLLRSSSSQESGDLRRRLLLGLQKGLIRAQARSAHFSIADDEFKKFNWPVPEWTWQLRNGELLLAEDRFIAVIDEFQPPKQVRSGPFNGLWKIELRELKIHKAEMLRNLDLTTSNSKGEVVHNKGNAIKDCRTWLEGEFIAGDRASKTKAALQDEALKRFDGKLNPTGFREAWKLAVVSCPARAQPGRPRGS